MRASIEVFTEDGRPIAIYCDSIVAAEREVGAEGATMVHTSDGGGFRVTMPVDVLVAEVTKREREAMNCRLTEFGRGVL